MFYPPFLDNPDLFPEDEVAVIFEPIMDVYELSVQLLASIEEMVEMASEMEGGTLYPQIGFSFEEVAEVIILCTLFFNINLSLSLHRMVNFQYIYSTLRISVQL